MQNLSVQLGAYGSTSTFIFCCFPPVYLVGSDYFMGSAASLPQTLPDSIDEATCKTLTGDRFEQAEFDQAKDEAGNITKEQFTTIWNKKTTMSTEGEVKTTTETTAATTGPPPDTTPVDIEVQKKFHSMCRWNKPAEEIAAFISENPGCQNSVDAANGNYPLHIASQNGHVDLVKQLLSIGVIVDAQNGTGTTALHVSFYCWKTLSVSFQRAFLF